MNDTSKKYLIISGLLFLASYAAYRISKSIKGENASEEGYVVEIDEQNGSDTPAFPLKKGMRGNNVLLLQKHINYQLASTKMSGGYAYNSLKEDGIFGTITEGMVKLFFNQNEVTQSQFNKLVLKR